MSDDRSRDLIQRYFDGVASADETAELDRRRAGDPEAAKAFAEASRLDGALDDHFRGAKAVSAAFAGLAAGGGAPGRGETEEGRRASRTARLRVLKSESFARRWWVPAVAAAVLVGLAVALVREGGDGRTLRSAPTPAPDEAALRAAREEYGRLEVERRRIQERLAANERERERAARVAAGTPPGADGPLARIEASRKQIEEEMARTVDGMRRAQETIARAEAARGETATPPAPPEMAGGGTAGPDRGAGTAVALARLERVQGRVFVVREGLTADARAGQGLHDGEGLWTVGPDGLAEVRFPDGTKLELAADTTIARLEGPSAAAGRRVVVERGALAANVSRQPPGRPMAFVTPHGDAVVMGTRFALSVTRESTQLEVHEGRVRLTRRADDAWVDVTAGLYAVAATGGRLVARTGPPPVTFPESLTIHFGPEGTVLPEGVLNDSGAEYDAARGYGWEGPNDVIPTMRDRKEPRRHTGLRSSHADPLRGSHLGAGTSHHAETWQLRVPNGRYRVTVCLGDPDTEQGPHHVRLEGHLVIDAVLTKPGEFLERKDVPVFVKDGFLTMTVGGYGGRTVSADGSSDTILNFVTIRRVPDAGK